jgi:hypothetical protein
MSSIHNYMFFQTTRSQKVRSFQFYPFSNSELLSLKTEKRTWGLSVISKFSNIETGVIPEGRLIAWL